MSEQNDLMEGLEEAYRDGLVDMEIPGDPQESTKFALSEHGRAYSRDLLRENDEAVLLLLTIALDNSESPSPKELAQLSVHIAEDAGVNAYRVIQRNEDKVPWLSNGAITDEMVEAMEEHVNA
jgi:hypothetical protein